MVSVATALPGYQDYCSHQHEIHDRCEEWANCIENKSKYFPCGVGSTPKDSKTEGNAWNLLNAEFTRNRIRYAVEALNNQSSLKSSITDRYLRLKEFGIGGETLYKYLDLWHPEHLNKLRGRDKSLSTQISLVDAVDRDARVSKGSSDRIAPDNPEIARDARLGKGLRHDKAADRLPAWEFDRVDRVGQKGRSRSV